MDRYHDQRLPRRGANPPNYGTRYDNQRRPYSPNRRRSRSPTRRRSRSPAHRRSRSPARRRSRSPARRTSTMKTKQDFQPGASGKPHSACAVCLGRHPHPVRDCNASTTWDGTHEVASKRINGDLVLRSNNSRLCLDWQRAQSCPSQKHDNRHRCSGCGDATHGAQHCPRAQKASGAHTL